MQKQNEVVDIAKHHLREARRNVERASKVVEDMKWAIWHLRRSKPVTPFKKV